MGLVSGSPCVRHAVFALGVLGPARVEATPDGDGGSDALGFTRAGLCPDPSIVGAAANLLEAGEDDTDD
ncbi:hypothetical protein [Streptomyces albiflavescens]|uniref:hypothetical protein n=1 Tax=Streptomyces albiflavescens TaxID=1623582 RepID=UPI0016683E34|nr:hypothetical protein [Streptomyces albiflavescens]